MQPQRGISTRVLLIGALVLVIGGVTTSSLLVLRSRMHQQVLNDFSADLDHSVETFQSFESQRLAALRRENSLLADLPSLKALMTTSDEPTITDGAIQFWKLGGSDLFALASNDGHVISAYARNTPQDTRLRATIASILNTPDKHFLLNGSQLFEYAVRPVYFGSDTTGTLLGYVVSGYAVDASFLRQINRSSSAEVAFLSQGRVIASTLQPDLQTSLSSQDSLVANTGNSPITISLGKQRFLLASEDISSAASAPLRLVVLKSFHHAEQSQHEINRLLVLVGISALFGGTALMLMLASMVTRPLELLARNVRAFGSGDPVSSLPERGTLEVRELNVAFAAMRDEIQGTHQALLESERLATIGRMASSVSHDLRHYLAAVYANAEFLASSRLSEEERADLFDDIRMAVLGTTELIESLLIFSRTNGAVQRVPELVATLLDRAIALVRSHPDAVQVQLKAICCDPYATTAIVDSKQMERAIYNLLLNACQAARGSVANRSVTALLETTPDRLTLRITDDGAGVSNEIRESLFDPFVSEGKQHGTGLGLTLANVVAQEHGGSVELVSSRPGETVFLLSIARGMNSSEYPESEDPIEVAR